MTTTTTTTAVSPTFVEGQPTLSELVMEHLQLTREARIISERKREISDLLLAHLEREDKKTDTINGVKVTRSQSTIFDAEKGREAAPVFSALMEKFRHRHTKLAAWSLKVTG